MTSGVYYSDYLQLDKLLEAQALESDKAPNAHAHDEMLFIIIHQSYELWFKQITYEIESVMAILSQPEIADSSPDMYMAHHRLQRVVTILQLLVDKITILETMTPLDFLDFRDMLRPASGFQSIQFKIIEALLGLKMENRFGQEYYLSQLRPEDAAKIRAVEERKPLISLVKEWLERMPFFGHEAFWEGSIDGTIHPFWQQYRAIYAGSLSSREQFNLDSFDKLLLSAEADSTHALSPGSRRAALFVMLYRDYPLLQLPYRLINTLLEIDEGISTWRYRHMSMVHRIIGMRSGTGGSTGKDYLKGALDKHYIFDEFAALTSFLIERSKLPTLSATLKGKLGFVW